MTPATPAPFSGGTAAAAAPAASDDTTATGGLLEQAPIRDGETGASEDECRAGSSTRGLLLFAPDRRGRGCHPLAPATARGEASRRRCTQASPLPGPGLARAIDHHLQKLGGTLPPTPKSREAGARAGRPAYRMGHLEMSTWCVWYRLATKYEIRTRSTKFEVKLISQGKPPTSV